MQIDQKDSVGRAVSRAVLLSNPVMDTHVGAGSQPGVSEVLQRLMDMMRQEHWFHSFVPRDVGGSITMSEALGCSTLLVSTAYDIQLTLVCPHIHQYEKRYSESSDVEVLCAFQKERNYTFFLHR